VSTVTVSYNVNVLAESSALLMERRGTWGGENLFRFEPEGMGGEGTNWAEKYNSASSLGDYSQEGRLKAGSATHKKGREETEPIPLHRKKKVGKVTAS